MISGEFNERGELFFEIGLIATDNEIIFVQALLDTGFTGWLALNQQDAESLGWVRETQSQEMETAQGNAKFGLYRGKVRIDGEEFGIQVVGGERLENIMLGVLWLKEKRLVVDFKAGVLTLG
ncbi:MAG: aspartyl protease [Cyanobacteriota bacterium]|nr:aspartyl protease [Cyanobacteriota bacterium]